MNEKKVTVLKMTVEHVMGIEHFELVPGKSLTRISAPNETGKTSLANSIDSLSKCGLHEASLLRKGATEGRIVFELDNGMSVQKKIKETKSEISVSGPDGKKMKTPAAVVAALLNPNSVNPISFFTATKEERKKILLKALPVFADPARLEAVTGQKFFSTGNAWDVIAAARKHVFEERTETNRAEAQKRATIKSLKDSLPIVDEHFEDVATITEEMRLVDEKKDMALAKGEKHLHALNEKFRANKLLVEQERDEKTKSAKDEIEALNAKIKVLEDGIAATESEFTEKLKAIGREMSANEQKAANYREQCVSEWKISRNNLSIRMTNSENTIKQQGAFENQIKSIKRLTEEAETLKIESDRKTEMLENLDQYKDELLRSLPIKGLELRGDDILHNGVLWDGLNEAKRMQLSFDIAKLQIGDCPFMFVDGIEHLDYKNVQLFNENVIKSGVQCVSFEVDRSPDANGFTVEVVE